MSVHKLSILSAMHKLTQEGQSKTLAAVSVAIFIAFGITAILPSNAATPSINLEAEDNNAIVSGANVVTGDSTASGGGYIRFGALATGGVTPGIQLIWPLGRDRTQTTVDFVHSGQIKFEWDDIEPARNEFCWDNPVVWSTDNSARLRGCGTSTDNSAQGLASQLAYYKSINKPVSVQVNSSQKPSWIYDIKDGGGNNLILKCGYREVGLIEADAYDVPQYWESDGTLNAAYFDEMDSMLGSLANTINASPNKSTVMGIRSAPNLIGTEHSQLNDGVVVINNPAAVCQKTGSGYSDTLGKKAYVKSVADTDRIMRAKGIRTILRIVALGNMSSLGDGNILCSPTIKGSACVAKYLSPDANGLQSWFFNTSSQPDEPTFNKGSFMYQWAKTGKGVAYHEPLQYSEFLDKNTHQPLFPNPVSWNYWRVLSELDRGTTYIAMYGQDVALGTSTNPSYNPEYKAAFDFGNKYAGFNDSNAAQAPGAWIAFAPGVPGDSCVTHGNLGLYITQLNSETTSTGLSSISDGSCFSTNKNPGVSMIGSSSQRFGRWARKTSGVITLQLSDAFKNSLSGNVKIRVTYLNSNNGNFKVIWPGGSSTISKGNNNTWATTPDISVPASSLKAGDLQLVTNDSGGTETTFHMVEVNR